MDECLEVLKCQSKRHDRWERQLQKERRRLKNRSSRDLADAEANELFSDRLI